MSSDYVDKIVVWEGEKYTIYALTTHVGSEVSEVRVADCDLTEESLEEEARDYFFETLQPEWGWRP